MLRDLLVPNGELLPLRYARGEYLAYHVTRMVAALDEGASAVTRFLSSGRVMSIERDVFEPGKLTDAAIFKIPQQPKAFVFVTPPFVERVAGAGLTGFRFRKVWEQT